MARLECSHHDLHTVGCVASELKSSLHFSHSLSAKVMSETWSRGLLAYINETKTKAKLLQRPVTLPFQAAATALARCACREKVLKTISCKGQGPPTRERKMSPYTTMSIAQPILDRSRISQATPDPLEASASPWSSSRPRHIRVKPHVLKPNGWPLSALALVVAYIARVSDPAASDKVIGRRIV